MNAVLTPLVERPAAPKVRKPPFLLAALAACGVSAATTLISLAAAVLGAGVMRLRRIVVAACLMQAGLMCFVLVPIKAVAYSATLDAPATWWILDPNTVWLSLRCLGFADPMTCFQTVEEIFQLSKALGVRIGICLIALATGALTFHQVCAKLNPGR